MNHNERRLQVLALSVLYLFMSLAVVFFLPKAALRYGHSFSKVKTHAQFSKNHFQNFLRRTDKISSSYSRKFFTRDRLTDPILLIHTSGIKTDVILFKLLNTYNLKARQAVHHHCSVNCCWRI